MDRVIAVALFVPVAFLWMMAGQVAMEGHRGTAVGLLAFGALLILNSMYLMGVTW